jgi:hypothetical protein
MAISAEVFDEGETWFFGIDAFRRKPKSERGVAGR